MKANLLMNPLVQLLEIAVLELHTFSSGCCPCTKHMWVLTAYELLHVLFVICIYDTQAVRPDSCLGNSEVQVSN